MARTEVVAMILAGGQGSRLGVLTKTVAKPAVPFGSRYRIIDFPLSNCVNSGIEIVGVLTQYQPLALNTYVGNGHPWDLDRNNAGAYILPPFQSNSGSDWYKGTANAIYQNMSFIDDNDPEYVVILSGDHIYKMDYAAMLKAHIEKKEFEEKPANPKSNLASMGVYIFTWSVLRQALIEDEANPNSNNDFGKNIVPNLLAQGKKLCAYRFSGYWKDVGTISSLWETNMDILDKPEEINLVDRSWKIFSRNPVKPSHFIGSGAKVKNSALTDGCRIFGDVEHSVLSESVIVEKGAIVKDCVLMPGVVVKEGAHIERCVIDQGTVIGKNVQAGSFVEGEGPYTNHKICSEGICVFERGLTIKEGAVIPKNSMIDSDLEVPEDCKIIESKFRA